MVFERELAIRLLYMVGSGVLLESKNLVWIDGWRAVGVLQVFVVIFIFVFVVIHERVLAHGLFIAPAEVLFLARHFRGVRQRFKATAVDDEAARDTRNASRQNVTSDLRRS